MRNIFTILFMVCVATMMAEEVTFDFTQQGYQNTQQVTSGVIDASHNTMWKVVGGQHIAAYYTSGTALRVYAGSSFIVSSDKKMAKIVLTISSSTTFEQEATQTPNDTSFTWTYVAELGNVRIQKVTVTYMDYLTTKEVMEEYGNLNLSSGSVSSNAYKVRAYVTQWNSGYPQYQNADFYVDDTEAGSTSLLRCFRLIAENETDKRKLNVGDYVEINAHLMNFEGQAEMKEGTFHVLSAVTPPPTKTYTLTITAGQGGSVNNSVNGTYEEGASVIVAAIANDGYTFKQWSDGNTDNPRTIIMTKDYSISAEFEKEYTCPYPELEGKKGNEILEHLHAQIVNHTVLAYDNVRADKAKVDLREDGTIWDMYSSCTFNPSDYCNSSNYNTTTECECYNREHALPKSWWGGSTTEPMYTDLHHILPTDNAANQQRGAWAYGEVTETPVWSNLIGSKLGYGTFGHSGNNYVFEPADEYKGDIARIYFYMITCYNDRNFTQAGKGYQMFTYSNGIANFTSGAIDFLLRWHRADPISEKEQKRNDAVEQKQGNRNPFVDAPELVEYIWGNKKTVVYTCDKSKESNETILSESSAATKVLRDGQILIQRGEKTYTLQGQEINW